MIAPDAEIDKGWDCYDPENRVFPKIAGAEAGQKLSKRDVLLIMKWKVGLIKDSHSRTVSGGNMVAINSAVADACKADCEIAAVEALCKLPEIGLAVATAILTVCYPDKFTIIDTRVLEMLDLFPSDLAERKRQKYRTVGNPRTKYLASDWTPAGYVNEYLPKVKQCGERWGCTLRKADRALWGLSVSRGIDLVIAKSERV